MRACVGVRVLACVGVGSYMSMHIFMSLDSCIGGRVGHSTFIVIILLCHCLDMFIHIHPVRIA